MAILLVLAIGLLMASSGPAWAQENGAIEYAEDRTDAVATYTATDPEGAAISWSLGGTDASDFMIENGVLRFKKSPDFEKPMGGTADPPTSNTYEVEVKATDETMKVATETVTVKVINVDEAGKVTLSARRPQTDTAFMASVTDPDGMVSDDKWQWAKAGSKNGNYRDIDEATSATYTPKDADAGSYLRVTVTYEDPQGEGKTAMMVSEFSSQRITGGNDAPEFDDDQDPVTDGDQADAERSVAENTDAGKTVGSPLTATDDNGDTLTYTLTDEDGGTDGDSASFGIDWGTGQILTKGDLDHETGGEYTVVVRATDPSGIPGVDTAENANSDTVTVVITVTDVNEAPAVTGEATATFDEATGDITTALDTYNAADEDDNGNPHPGTVTGWSVNGADGSKFTAEGGDLKFKKKPDYENPTDANEDNVYEVTVQATDGKLTGMKKVMVTVENANEDGVVTLSKAQPVVGIPVKASLTDPDGGISKLTWQWSISSGAVSTTAGDIEDANSDTYTPVAGDVDGTLTATASYFDGESAVDDTTKKTANKVADNGVERDTRNNPPVFGDEDPDTEGTQNSMATRKVEENTKALAGSDDDDNIDTDASADNVGGAVTATDTKADGTAETLTYSLGGTDAGSFRVRDNGQIEVASGTELDYETKDTYMVTVMAEDPLGASASIPVTITVTDVDEMPEVSGDEEVDYREKGTGPVATYTATDPEGASVKWSLDGTDASDFMIENGVLRFKKSPDFEKPMGGTADPPTSNTYTVMVKATDETMKVGTETVMVKVTNVDEAGKVTLSARRPQTDTAFMASVTDPDGMVSDDKWQWAKAGSKNGNYRDIDEATSATYTPKDADAGSYLRVTVTYEDPQGEGKTAMMVSEFSSQRITGGNDAPEFDDDQDPVTDGDQADAERSVAENTDAGKTVGSPLTATDDNGDTLTYTLTDEDGGTDGDSASFGIDWGTGQILTKGDLDHETGGEYTVVVRATDPSGIPGVDTAENANSDTVTVVITVTDVNEAPAVTGEATATFDEATGDITTALDTYNAADEDDNGNPHPGTVTGWSVNGADGSKFTAEGGDLKFKKKPDYENPTDANEDNVYEVTVQATDGKLTGMKKVMVTVENANEDGVVTLSKAQPVVGIPVKASLTDPDGGISKLTWQWSISSGAVSTTAGDIEDANSDTYTPVAGDVDGTLTATASYFDGESAVDDTTKKTANKVADNGVERDTRNNPPVFGDEDPDTEGTQNSMATRKVEENTKALAGSDDDDNIDTDASADNVGGAVTATDTKADGTAETLTYSLGGTDAGSFRVRDNGQIEVASGTELDYETKDTYMVTVMAEDPLGASASIPVTITVTDVDEMPKITLGGLAISGDRTVEVEEGNSAVATYTAAGPNADMADWSVSGDDAGDFTIAGGELTFTNVPDFENPADADTDNVYEVTVEAGDGTYMDTHEVTVTVTNAEETGTVTLSSDMLIVGEAVTATVTDPDVVIAVTEMWQWARADDAGFTTNVEDIAGATMASYTPVEADGGKYLRASVTYDDGYGADAAKATGTDVVTVATSNMPPAFAMANTSRDVAENSEADAVVGDPVVATDPDNDDVTYTLSGDDAASFSIDDNGQITVGQGTMLDFETRTTYTVTVTATDPSSETATIEVTINVTNVGLDTPYDADDSGTVEKTEVISAINDYLDAGVPTKPEVIRLINLYLGD